MRKVYAVVAAILCTVIMSACGGGSSNDSTMVGTPPPTVPYTGGIRFGYFGTSLTQLEETKDHVDVVMVPAFGSVGNDYLNQMEMAHRAGIKVILSTNKEMYVKGTCRFDAFHMEEMLIAISNNGYLNDIIGFYPLDEPDLISNTNEIVWCNQQLRSFLTSKYPSLASAKLLAIYYQSFPGSESYDWIGTSQCKDCDFVANVPIVAPQGLILIPYGADPWHRHPAKAVEYAKSNPNVKLVLPFLWADGGLDTGAGIRSNGLKLEYQNAGKELTLK